MFTSHFSSLDAIILAVYFVGTVTWGLWLGRRKITTDVDLFLADREATWPLIGASLFSANISSQQFVGQAGLAYLIGIAAGGFQLVGAMCFMFLALFFVDVYLGLRLRTAPEFFSRRYNNSTRVFVAGINIVMILAANIMTALYAGSAVMNDLLGWHGPWALGVGVVLVALAAGLYTILGGLRSVLWVDLLQASVLVLGGSVVLLMCVRAAGGPAGALDIMLPNGASAWSVVQGWDQSFGWLPLLTGAMILGIHSHCTDQDYVQRALAGRNAYHAKMGALFGALLKIGALFIIAAPGVLAAKLIPGMAVPDRVYARLIAEYLPPGLTGLVLAGLLAAILGSVSAGLSASSSMISFDFVQRLRPGLSEAQKVRLGRIIMIVVLVGCAVVAPSITGFKGLYGYLVRLWSMLAPPVFVCVVFGIFTRRATARGAVCTLVVGSVLGGVSFWLLGLPEVMQHFPRYLRNALNVGFVITLICAATMLVCSGRAPGAANALQEGAPVERPTMTPGERRKFRVVLVALSLLLVGVIWFFSPWGAAKPRAATVPPAAVQP